MYVSAPGLVCPVGLDAESACAAMQAAIAPFEELPFRANGGQPLIGAVVPGIDDKSRHGRAVDLLCQAVEATLDLASGANLKEIPLIVCLPEPERPGGCGSLAHEIVGIIESRLKAAFHPTFSGAVAKGHTAGFRALRAARRLMRDKQVSSCLLCATDSLINADTLHWLYQNDRLKTDNNSDGVIPGEAAAALMMSLAPPPGPVAVKITGLGFARETAVVASDDPLLGLGMTEAVKAALAEANLSMHEIDFRISDVAGESYAFRELALVVSRLMRVRREELPLWHAADSIGEVGAAAGLCQVIVAALALLNDNAPGHRALCHSASIGGERAAAALYREYLK